jgi:hypothetical protein
MKQVIWCQHNACQNFQWESHDTWFFKFQLPPLLHELSKDNWNEVHAELFGCFLHFFMLKVILKVYCPQLKFGPLYNICTTHRFALNSWLCPQTLILTFWKSLKMFSLIWNKPSHKHIAQENYCRKICQASKTHIHSNRNRTMTKQTRTIQFVAFAWGNSLLNSTTSGTLLHLHVGVPIQKFRKCTDPLPMFCS